MTTTTPYAITQADTAILRALNRFHYLTAGQTSRLLYPRLRDEHRYVQRRLKRLVEAGYVLRLRALPAPRFGTARHVFTLARRGRQYLEASGIPTPGYFRPSEEEAKARNHPFMTHTLATIDVLIAAELLCQSPDVSMPRLLIERELKAHPARVALVGADETTRSVAVIPDAWLQLEVHGEAGPCSISLELDRGSEDQKAWRAKVAALAAWAEGPYAAAFATDNLTIAVVTPKPARRDELRDWTARELAERGRGHLGEIFLFTSADPVIMAPSAFFFDPVWHPPGDGSAVSLLDRPAVSAGEPTLAPRDTPAPTPSQRVAAVPVWQAGPRQEAVVEL